MKRYPEMCLQLENDEDRKSLHSMETDRVCTYSLVDVTKMIDERRKRSVSRECYYNNLREDEAVTSQQVELTDDIPSTSNGSDGRRYTQRFSNSVDQFELETTPKKKKGFNTLELAHDFHRAKESH